MKKVIAGVTMQQILDSGAHSEEEVYCGIHLLASKRFIIFNAEARETNFKNHMSRIEKLAKEIDGKNYFEIFEILGISRNANDNELNKAYQEISKFLHPDKLIKAPDKTKELTLSVFSQISAAHSILTNKDERSKYMDQLSSKEAEQQIKYESALDHGKDLLKRGKTNEAMMAFRQAKKIMKPTTELKLNVLWAKVKNLKSQIPDRKIIKDFELELMHVPPEERHTSTYYFVKGLYSKLVGDMEAARRNFELAINEDDNLIEARRELNLLNLETKRAAGGLGKRSDLTDMITSIFRKRR